MPLYLNPVVRGVIDALAIVGGIFAFVHLLAWALGP